MQKVPIGSPRFHLLEYLAREVVVLGVDQSGPINADLKLSEEEIRLLHQKVSNFRYQPTTLEQNR